MPCRRWPAAPSTAPSRSTRRWHGWWRSGTSRPARERRQIARAVHALQQAEQRTALAATMVREVLARPDAALVPSSVLDFLCGPWAQVVAQARITDRSGADDPGGYAGLIDDLMWSAQPALTRQDVPALRRMVPRLQQGLQQGLAIDRMPGAADAGVLCGSSTQLHQRGLDQQAFADTEIADAGAARRAGAFALERIRQCLAGAVGGPGVGLHRHAAGRRRCAGCRTGPAQLVVGVWVALLAEGSWTRTRLAWTSANGSLLLFSDALGFIQSLVAPRLRTAAWRRASCASSRPTRSRTRSTRWPSTALRNSVDIRF